MGRLVCQWRTDLRIAIGAGAVYADRGVGHDVVERQHHYGEVFISHGAYVDKTFFAVELFSLISRIGLAYGLDAALLPYVPTRVSNALVGATPAEVPSRRIPSAQPVGLSAA